MPSQRNHELAGSKRQPTRAFPLCQLILGVIGAMCSNGLPSAAAPPSILLILADDVGREVLGCYGGTSYATPNIDRLAASGIRFNHYYTMPVCHPTRIALLTGQYPYRLGNPAWGSFPMWAEGRTIAQVLKRAGYVTAIAGKWQLALLKDDLGQPRRLGFDEYCLYGWHEGPWYYEPRIWQNGQLRTDVRDRYGPDVMCDYIIDFIRRQQQKPFFALYSMSLCHAETNDLDHPAPVGPQGRYDTFAEMVTKMDVRVGRVIAVLDELNLRERTLVLYCSDNGTAAHNLIDAVGDEYVYEPIISKMGNRAILGGKATLSDWGTRVPFIASQPGTILPHQVSDELVDVADLLPTVADVAGASLPKGIPLDGRSIAALGGQSAPRDWVFAEHEGKCFVRNQRWKLYDDGRFLDMNADPDEEHAIPDDGLTPEATNARRELQQALEGLRYPRH